MGSLTDTTSIKGTPRASYPALLFLDMVVINSDRCEERNVDVVTCSYRRGNFGFISSNNLCKIAYVVTLHKLMPSFLGLYKCWPTVKFSFMEAAIL